MADEVIKRQVSVLGMELDEWEYKSCVAHFGVGEDWACLYDIESKQMGCGHATTLLQYAKKYYEPIGKRVVGSVALNPTMKHIYEKLNITEMA